MKNLPNIIVLVFFLFVLSTQSFPQRKTQNVILVTLDGARLQEMFGGVDAEVFKSVNKNFEKNATYKKFWAETPTQRREKLLPFFWTVLMKNHGSIAGNRELNSIVKTTNKMFFSYPGYSELLTGESHDDIINTNSFGQNRFPSFLNFLQKKMRLDYNQTAAFGSWNVIVQIDSNDPKAFLANSGYADYSSTDRDITQLNEAQSLIIGPDLSVRPDYFTYKFALAHLKKYHPRVMHLSFGETDDWAHQREYEKYLISWHRTDIFLKELWDFLQNDKQYRDKTTLIITIDHGRGNTPKDWDDHGQGVPEAQYIWMAFVSPDVSLRGEWENSKEIYQNQVAATLCKFLSFDYREQNPNAGKPVEILFEDRR